MRYLVWILLVLLVLVQQDYWRWWDAPVVILSFLPRPLAVQMGVSIAAGFLWWLATQFCWPLDHGPDSSAGPPRRSDSAATDGVQASRDKPSNDKGVAS